MPLGIKLTPCLFSLITSSERGQGLKQFNKVLCQRILKFFSIIEQTLLFRLQTGRDIEARVLEK